VLVYVTKFDDSVMDLIQKKQSWGAHVRRVRDAAIAGVAELQAAALAPLPHPKPMARAEIPLQASDGGSYYLPVTINQTLSVPFLLDTGAEGLQIPFDVYLVLMRKGGVSPSDARGFATVITADGGRHKQPRFMIHELKVGDRIITDVLATVSATGTDLLLGQSFLARLGSYTIDNQRHVLTLG
jgi:clan AA aspartic protease (TIGR02281 family)